MSSPPSSSGTLGREEEGEGHGVGVSVRVLPMGRIEGDLQLNSRSSSTIRVLLLLSSLYHCFFFFTSLSLFRYLMHVTFGPIDLYVHYY